MYEVLKEPYMFQNIHRTVKKRIKRSDVCQKVKVSNQNTKGPLHMNLLKKPLEVVSLDFMGPLPRKQRGMPYCKP